MAKIVGVDLGTTNSCAATLEGGDPLPNPDEVVAMGAAIQAVIEAHNTLDGLIYTVERD